MTKNLRPRLRTLKGLKLQQIFWLTQLAFLFVLVQRTITVGFNINEVIMLSTMSALGFVYWFSKAYSLSYGIGLFILILTLFFCSMMWLNDGTRDEVILGIPAIICFAAMLEQKKLYYLIFGIAALNILAIGVANDLNWIDNFNSGSSTASSVLLLTILFVVAYTIQRVTNELQATKNKLLKHKSQLEVEVKKRTQELEKSLLKLSEAQQQIIQNEKMASLGKLVAGIAHELNTPFGVSITATSVAQSELKDLMQHFEDQTLSKSQLRSSIETLNKSTSLSMVNLQRAGALINEFKKTSIEHNPNPISTFNLSATIDQVVLMVGPKADKFSVAIEQSCPDDLQVSSSKNAIIQILTILITNSIIHAFQHIKDPTITIHAREIDQQILLEYADNGIGISTESQARIFEPFFTTKRADGNTGLGMHIAFNLASFALYGSLKLVAPHSPGVKFEIRFPKNIESSH